VVALFIGILYLGRSLSKEDDAAGRWLGSAFIGAIAAPMMLLIFAAWALFGLGYPSAPLPFGFNAVSKVVAFVVALSLFLPPRGQPRAPEPTAADDPRYPGHGDPSGDRVVQ
jgi:hypothetical protein